MTSQHQNTRTGKPFSIRLTSKERLALQQAAGGVPLGSFIKSALLKTKPNHDLSINRDLLARALAILGQSGIGVSLEQLVRHAASGSLELDAWSRTRLLDACEDFQAVRDLLMEALGKKPPLIKGSGLSAVFNKAAADKPSLSFIFNAAAGSSEVE